MASFDVTETNFLNQCIESELIAFQLDDLKRRMDKLSDKLDKVKDKVDYIEGKFSKITKNFVSDYYDKLQK